MTLTRRLICISLLTLAFAVPAGGLSQSAELRRVAAPPLHRIPPRPSDAMAGSRFAQRIVPLSGARREQAILAELRRGNIPDRLRNLQPVTVTAQRRNGATAATVWVMPDYLAVGSDADSVRVPIDFYTAATIAREWNLSLPTRQIVDAVWRAATVKLPPMPMQPGPQMTSTRYFMQHDERIRAALGTPAPEAIVAGQKKDLVLSNLLLRQPPRVAIYGWHRKNGAPIQPLSIVHGATYTDYSHGVRLVSRVVEIGGHREDLFEVVANPDEARLLTVEGKIADPSKLLALQRPGSQPARAR